MQKTAPAKFTGGITFEASTKDLKRQWEVKQHEIIHFTPERVYLPIQQHIGAPGELLVSIGDEVAKGQLIAKANGFVSANVHASISGTVIDILEWPDASGGKVESIVIQRASDRSDTAVNEEMTAENFTDLSVEELIQRVSNAGVVGMGGATFPTHVKLTVDEETDVETIVLNSSECEPFLEADNLLMQLKSQKILTGARIAQKILGAKRIIIAIEDDKPEAVQAMKIAVRDFSDISVTVVDTSYPQGGEKQLLESVLGVEVPLNGLPVETGAYLMNVATSAAVAAAVELQAPLIQRYCTVTGDVQQRQTVSCPIGTLTGDLLDFCGGFSGNPVKVYLGGPMMGKAINTLEVPITKSSNGLVIVNTDHYHLFEESPCIRCNLCAEVCPMRLEPQNIDLYYRAGEDKRCDDLMAEACINCGCCTYVCPARRNLAQNITAASAKIKKLKQEAEEND